MTHSRAQPSDLERELGLPIATISQMAGTDVGALEAATRNGRKAEGARSRKLPS